MLFVGPGVQQCQDVVKLILWKGCLQLQRIKFYSQHCQPCTRTLKFVRMYRNYTKPATLNL